MSATVLEAEWWCRRISQSRLWWDRKGSEQGNLVLVLWMPREISCSLWALVPMYIKWGGGWDGTTWSISGQLSRKFFYTEFWGRGEKRIRCFSSLFPHKTNCGPQPVHHLIYFVLFAESPEANMEFSPLGNWWWITKQLGNTSIYPLQRKRVQGPLSFAQVVNVFALAKILRSQNPHLNILFRSFLMMCI